MLEGDSKLAGTEAHDTEERFKPAIITCRGK